MKKKSSPKKKTAPKKAAKKKPKTKPSPYGLKHRPRGKSKPIDFDDLDPDDIRNWDRSEFGDSF